MNQLYRINDTLVLKIFRLKYMDILNLTYIICDEISKKTIIIDPSWEYEKIDLFLSENNFIPEAIFLTHSHFDHVNLADKISKQYNCPVYMSEKEIQFYDFSCENLIPLKSNYTDCLDTRLYHIHTPGHTIGSVCYSFENCLFTGDTLFIETCGVCNMNGGSYYDMFRSINYLSDIIDDDVRVFPGHEYRASAGECFKKVKESYIFRIKDEETFLRYRKVLDKQSKISQVLVDFFGAS